MVLNLRYERLHESLSKVSGTTEGMGPYRSSSHSNAVHISYQPTAIHTEEQANNSDLSVMIWCVCPEQRL